MLGIRTTNPGTSPFDPTGIAREILGEFTSQALGVKTGPVKAARNLAAHMAITKQAH